jgi:hypothetical protein
MSFPPNLLSPGSTTQCPTPSGKYSEAVLPVPSEDQIQITARLMQLRIHFANHPALHTMASAACGELPPAALRSAPAGNAALVPLATPRPIARKSSAEAPPSLQPQPPDDCQHDCQDENRPPADSPELVARALLMARLAALKKACNQGFGVVPITNSFTVRLAPIYSASRRQCEAPLPGPGAKLVLIQVGFPAGRQSLFQACALADSGERVQDLVHCGQHVLLFMDNGLDCATVRGVEPLPALVPLLPEVPFTRVVRRLTPAETHSLADKAKDEAKMLTIISGMLFRRQGLGLGMRVVETEFQFDRRKLTLFVEMTRRLGFAEFVKAIVGSKRNIP